MFKKKNVSNLKKVSKYGSGMKSNPFGKTNVKKVKKNFTVPMGKGISSMFSK